MADEETEQEVVIRGGRGPGYQPYDLANIAAALSAYAAGAYYGGDPGAEATAAAVAASVPGLEAPPAPLAEVVVAAPRPSAPTPPPSILEDLLSRPRAPAPAPPTEFQQLLERPPPSEFERLLQKPRTPPAAPLPEVTITGSKFVRAAGRLAGPLGIVSLLPTMYHVGVTLDQLATDSWTRRLFGEPGEDAAQERAPRRPRAPAGSAGEDDDAELATVTVEGRAPRRPTLAMPYLGVPGLGDPVGAPAVFAEPSPDPRDRPALSPLPPGLIEPGVLTFADPLPQPRAVPAPNPALNPNDAVVAPPTDLQTPAPPRGPLAPPLTWPGGLGASDPCDCKGTKTKKKPKKPRNVCWKGSYVERSTGLSKTRRVRVDCASGEELGSSAPSPPAPKPRRPKSKSPNPIPPSWELP